MIKFRHKGDFSKVTHYFERVRKTVRTFNFDKYGQQGVEALASATPVDTGLTSRSWYYEIEKTNGMVRISFCNSNIQNMDTEPVMEVGLKGEITLIPQFSLFLMKLQKTRGGR